ncbi:hypothetical protein RHSIM_Rhsim13G0039700 [Rhododendron simsii]|uniref:Uncharacterized protein n=1 Tax=Rhododendron simsii TaxID=118357 RepID=A0A834FYL7_RHOSS|nr:hypothetical protein RHSIM_Rhsim13G0039700 [Rhododendron simsii]
MAPNPKVVSAFRAMRVLGISEEKVKPVLKNLLKLYDKNWELIEEENYRALADAIFDQEETQAAEQKNERENAAQAEMEEEAEPQEEPERPLKRLRLRYQEGHASPSFGNCSPRSGGNSLKQPKPEEDGLPQTSPPQQSQDIAESFQPNVANIGAASPPLSPLPLVRNKGKQPVLSKPLSIPERSEPSQPGAASRTQLKEKGKEPLSIQTGPRDKKSFSERSTHAVKPGIVLSPKQLVSSSITLIEPKDEPVTDDLPQFTVPLAVITPEPSGRENSSGVNGSIRGADGPGLVSPQHANGNVRSDGVPPSSIERRITRQLAKASCYSEIASTPSREETIDVTPAGVLSKESKALDMGTRGKQCGPSNGSISINCAPEEACSGVPIFPPSSNGMDDCTKKDKNYTGNTCEIDMENEQNGLDHENSHSLGVVQRRKMSLRDVNDIAKGQENVVIPLVNDVNKEYPPSFQYIPQNVLFQNGYVNFSLARIGENCCSNCFGNCLSSPTPCACANETGGDFAYTLEGFVKEDFLEECISMNRDPQKHCMFYCKECPLERSKNDDLPEPCKGHLVRKFIKECWWKCGCSKLCGNRVVQRGINRKLQVFMTPGGKGWGLRTLEELPKGAFVCEYVGEILTNAELYERVSQSKNEEHAYPVLLDADWGSEVVLKDEEALCLDATNYGNVARFINHRCFDSTLVEIPVEVETPDHHYYHLAFFTTRKVDAMEELTWDLDPQGIEDEHVRFMVPFTRIGLVQ